MICCLCRYRLATFSLTPWGCIGSFCFLYLRQQLGVGGCRYGQLQMAGVPPVNVSWCKVPGKVAENKLDQQCGGSWLAVALIFNVRSSNMNLNKWKRKGRGREGRD